jgi:hypothetical protein
MSAAVCARPKHALGPVGTETSFFGFASGSRLPSSSLLDFHHIRPFPFALVGNSVAVASNGRRVELCGRSQSTRRWDSGTLGRRKRPAHRTLPNTRRLAFDHCPFPMPNAFCLPARPGADYDLQCVPRRNRSWRFPALPREIHRRRSPHFRLLSAPKSLQLSCPPRCLFPTSAFPGVFGLSLFPRFNLGNYFQDKETLTLFSAQITSRPLFLGSSRSVLDLTVFS